MQSEKIDQITAALLKAEGAMGVAVKDSANPFFKSKYADLATIQAVCEKPLAENGLVVVQGGGLSEFGNFVYTRLVHSSGQWMESQIALPSILKPQDMGSAITYYRRYGLAAILNITQEDDDGNLASRSSMQVAKDTAHLNGQKPDAVGMGKAGIGRATKIKEYMEANLIQEKEIKAALALHKAADVKSLPKDAAEKLINLGLDRELVANEKRKKEIKNYSPQAEQDVP